MYKRHPEGCAPLTATPCPSGTLTFTSDFDRLDVAIVVSPAAASPAPLPVAYQATLTSAGAVLSTRPISDAFSDTHFSQPSICRVFFAAVS